LIYKIITLDLDPEMIAIALSTFEKFEVTNRVKLIEGPAVETLKTLHGQFDIIFIDADKPGYKNYVQLILERGLLSKNGVIITDNSTYPLRYSLLFIFIYRLMSVLARGLVVDNTKKNPYHKEAWRHPIADAMRDFNDYVKNEPRLETVVLPLFDGLGLMRLKD